MKIIDQCEIRKGLAQGQQEASEEEEKKPNEFPWEEIRALSPKRRSDRRQLRKLLLAHRKTHPKHV